jgi:hypothetical protein
MKQPIPFYTAVAIALLSLGVAGCEQEGPVEEAGEEVDEAVENTGEKIEDATD